MSSDPRAQPSAYAQAGVDYEALDAGKRLALTAALATSSALAQHGGEALDASRGEPAFVFELDRRSFAFVVEGLGTKSMIARSVALAGGPNRFDAVAYDAVAAIVNDLCCTGALPLVVNAYFATGSSDWYAHSDWNAALIEGWRRACTDAAATWGGGESPSLAGLVSDDQIELAGSAVGVVPQGRSVILGDELAPGDEIVLVASSGLHANGASLARMIADGLPDGYATAMPSGARFGEALLDPSVIYVKLVEALVNTGAPVHYLSHITGHGFLKLMRPTRELSYRIERLPELPEVLGFLADQAELDDAAAYSTLNMGAGFAIYAAPGSGAAITSLAHDLGYDAYVAGRVEAGPRQVVIEQIDVTYGDDELDLAPDQDP